MTAGLLVVALFVAVPIGVLFGVFLLSALLPFFTVRLPDEPPSDGPLPDA